MGLIDKFKTMFVEEFPEEEVIKKKEYVVKIPNPEEKVYEEKKPSIIDDEDILPSVSEKTEPVKIEEVTEKPKSIPNFFDDDDFADVGFNDFEPEKPKVVKQEYKYSKTETTVSPVITGYGIKREDSRKKTFTPTPIISPVYGVLDKNYRKDEIRASKGSNNFHRNVEDKVNVDDIRKKAYGTLEDELESEMSDTRASKEDSLVEDFMNETTKSTKEKQPIDIFGEIDKKDALDDYLTDFKDDSTDLVEEELNKDYDKYEEEMKKSATKKYSDDDLFNLIDSMYRKKDGE